MRIEQKLYNYREGPLYCEYYLPYDLKQLSTIVRAGTVRTVAVYSAPSRKNRYPSSPMHSNSSIPLIWILKLIVNTGTYRAKYEPGCGIHCYLLNNMEPVANKIVAGAACNGS